MRVTYIRVQHGEHLSTIARLFATTEEVLLAANGLTRPEEVRPGMVLTVPPVEGRRTEGPRTGGPPVRAPAQTLPVRDTQPQRPPARQSAVRRASVWEAAVKWPSTQASQIICRGPEDRRAVALTFEASFGRDRAQAVLDLLRHHGVAATWFLSGEWMDQCASVAREISRAGQQVELHGHRHVHFRELTPEQLRGEIVRSTAVLRRVLGRNPRFLRPPFGSMSPEVEKVASEFELRVVLWSVDSLDWQNPRVEEIEARVLGGVHPGAIVLMHATADQAPGALARIIPGLRSAGYELATIDRLLGP